MQGKRFLDHGALKILKGPLMTKETLLVHDVTAQKCKVFFQEAVCDAMKDEVQTCAPGAVCCAGPCAC